MKIEWSRHGQRTMRRFMRDQEGMKAITVAVAGLALDPNPPEAFVRGEYRRLRVGPFRVKYIVEEDVITVDEVAKVRQEPSGD